MKKLILLLLFLFIYGCTTSVCPQKAYCPENAPYYSDKTGWCYSANISCPISLPEGACSYCTKEPDKIVQVKPSKTINTICEYAGSVDTLDNDIQTIAEGIYREDGLIMSGGYIHYDIHLSRFNSFLIKATIVPLYHNPSNDADYYIADPIGHLLKIVVMYDLHEKTILPAYGSTISDLEEACFGKNEIPGKDYSEEK